MKKKETADRKETENQKQLTKEQIAALKQEKKKTQEELDELRGKDIIQYYLRPEGCDYI